MHCLALGGILLFCFLKLSSSNPAPAEDNKCLLAKSCVHSGIEHCGVDRNGEVRRFFDSCDMLEYNCLYSTAYQEVKFSKCSHLSDPFPERLRTVKARK